MDKHPGSTGKGCHAGHSASLSFGSAPTFPVKYSPDGGSAFPWYGVALKVLQHHVESDRILPLKYRKTPHPQLAP